MERIAPIVRIVLGSIFVVFSLASFFPVLPVPQPTGELVSAMQATGYLWPFLKTVELVAGVLLLSGKFVPLALTMLAPVVVSILLFHAFLAPAALPLALLIVVMDGILIAAYWRYFEGVTRPDAEPGQG